MAICFQCGANDNLFSSHIKQWMVDKVQKPFRILCLNQKSCPILLLLVLCLIIAAVKHSCYPFIGYVLCKFICGTAQEYKLIQTKITLQFTLYKIYRTFINYYILHVAIAAIMVTLAFYRIPCMSDKLVHIAFARIQYHNLAILYKGNKILKENRLKSEKFYNQKVIAGKKETALMLYCTNAVFLMAFISKAIDYFFFSVMV